MFRTFCYINNVNAILKIGCFFLLFLTLAGLLEYKSNHSVRLQTAQEKILTGFNKISKNQPSSTRSKLVKQLLSYSACSKSAK